MSDTPRRLREAADAADAALERLRGTVGSLVVWTGPAQRAYDADATAHASAVQAFVDQARAVGVALASAEGEG